MRVGKVNNENKVTLEIIIRDVKTPQKYISARHTPSLRMSSLKTLITQNRPNYFFRNIPNNENSTTWELREMSLNKCKQNSSSRAESNTPLFA